MGTAKSSSVFPLDSLPDEVLGEVLGRVPAEHIVKSCVLVCKRWRDILTTQKLWKDKCLREHKYTTAIIDCTADKDYKRLFLKNPYGKNLVINPEAKKGKKDWTIVSNGGHGFQVEEKPIGSDPVRQYAELPGKDHVSCWATSYHECSKQQVIDLLDSGCSPEVLDTLRPDINVSEWYAARFDCGCKYEIKVELLSQDRSVLDVWEFEDEKDSGRQWYSIEHTFSNYPPGVRYICYTHGGQDTKWWAGHYGIAHTFSNYPPGVRYICYTHGGRDKKVWAGHYGVKFTLSTVKLDIYHIATPL